VDGWEPLKALIDYFDKGRVLFDIYFTGFEWEATCKMTVLRRKLDQRWRLFYVLGHQQKGSLLSPRRRPYERP